MENLEDLGIEYRTFSLAQINKVDRIVAMAKDRPTFVDGEKDWEIIWELFILFVEEYPEHYNDLQNQVAEYRKNLRNSSGTFKGDNGDLWQVQMEIPMPFHTMIKAIYPDQKFDKKFNRELAKRIPVLKVPDKI
jgi:hypothetical protein